ncbi:MAG: hypothetical protein SCH66_12085, partial [Methanolobus sp.]|nr:hypothetical protein [Methanolobus sp.]
VYILFITCGNYLSFSVKILESGMRTEMNMYHHLQAAIYFLVKNAIKEKYMKYVSLNLDSGNITS